MRTPGIGVQPPTRGPFPRPRVSIRELIGLVLAFAVSNAFLSWLNPMASVIPALVAIWNAVLTIYLGFAFLQSWIRSVSRWSRTGHADLSGRVPPRWTALGVAEATVIGGTMAWCLILLPADSGRPRFLGVPHDPTTPIAILALGSIAGLILLRMWRRRPGDSLTGHQAGPTMVGESHLD